MSLPPLPEDWHAALAVVAHPDDMEYGAANAVARWTGQGKSVAYMLVTRGEAGIDTLPPEEVRMLREAEERASAAVVGVTSVEFLGHADGVVEYGLPLRRDVTGRDPSPPAPTRRHAQPSRLVGRPLAEHGGPPPHRRGGARRGARRRESVGLHGHRRTVGRGALRVPGRLAGADACGRRDGHAGARDPWLREHRAYLEYIGGGTDFLVDMGRPPGAQLGTEYATSFEV